MADGAWDPAAFGLSSAPAAAPPQQSLISAAPAQSGGGAWDPAAFGLQPAPAPAPAASSGGGGQASAGSAAAPGTKTGILANAAAGAVEGGTAGLNALSDPFGNLIGKPAAIAIGTLHDVLAPMLGYHKFSPEDRAALFGDDGPQLGDRVAGAVQRAVDAPPLSSVQASTLPEQLVRSGVAGAVGMAAMGLGGAAEGVSAGALARTAAPAAALGASGGVTGELAAAAVPDEYKPAASLVGNIVGAGIPSVAATAGRGVILNPLMDFTAPAIGRRNALMDVAGSPIIGADGAPVVASSNQARLAGDQLQATTSNPAAVSSLLANPPAPLVDGVQPTTAQLTRDLGIGMQEYQTSRSGTPQEQAAFKARQDQQNDARVTTLQGVGIGGDQSALPAYLQQQAADIRSAGDARVAQAQTAAQAQIEQARTGTDQQVAGLQGQAGQALDAIGGNLLPGSDSQIGQMLRQPIQESLAQTRQRETKLWNAIDPDKTLAVDMSPVRDRANEIAQGIGPNAAPPTGEEASILDTARALPDVQNFSDLTDLRSRLTSQIRDARIGGRDQEVSRLSQLLDGVHDTMEGSVAGQSTVDSASVQAGQMAPENAIGSRLQAEANAYQQASRAQAGGDFGANYSANSGSGSSRVSGPTGTEIQTRGSSEPSSGGQSLQGQQSLAPNFDGAAQQRYADARQATSDRVATFKNAPGVGQALQKGATSGSFKAPDSAIPNVIVRAGSQGADVAKAYLKAGGSTDALSSAAAYSLRQSAMRSDGTLDPVKYQAWARDRAAFLSQIPEAASRFGAAADAQRAATDAGKSSGQALKAATATAQETVDNAMTARAAATKALQTSVLSKFLDGSDPVARVGSILRDKAVGQVQMRQLAKAVDASPEAKAGLQRAVGEYVTRELVGNSKGIASESGAIKADRFQTFLRSAGPALREVLTSDQVDALQRVGASLEQTNFISQVGVGSPTAQLTAGRGDTLMSRIGREIAGVTMGGASGSGIGFALAGPVGGYAGGIIGGAVGKAVQAAREAGIENVQHLKTEALLNPALFHLLMTKATRGNEPTLMNRLAAQFRRISLVGGVQASGEAERDARKVQPVARAPSAAVITPNVLFSLPPPAALMQTNSLFSR